MAEGREDGTKANGTSIPSVGLKIRKTCDYFDAALEEDRDVET